MAAWTINIFIAAVMLTVSGPASAGRHTPTLPMPVLADDGMYSQKWFYKSALDLRKDLAASERDGKRLVIFWEQKDCCQPMYEVNLRVPRVVDKIKKNFNVIRLDISGTRKVTDLDGTVMAENELAAKYIIRYSPTLQFLSESVKKAAGRNGKESEVLRIESYVKPFHFYFLFHYVESKGYESEPNFQRWLGDIGRGLQAKNIKYDLWANGLPPDLPDRY